jgi:hypothetical protein
MTRLAHGGATASDACVVFTVQHLSTWLHLNHLSLEMDLRGADMDPSKCVLLSAAPEPVLLPPLIDGVMEAEADLSS